MNNDTRPALSIGTIVGGLTPESIIWTGATQRLSAAVREIRGEIESSLRINIEFHIPGHILTPEFEGVRTGYFSRKDGVLKDSPARPATAGFRWSTPTVQHLRLLPGSTAGKGCDRIWTLVTEIDFDSTIIGGSQNLISEIVADPGFEALQIPEGADLTWDADVLNRPAI